MKFSNVTGEPLDNQALRARGLPENPAFVEDANIPTAGDTLAELEARNREAAAIRETNTDVVALDETGQPQTVAIPAEADPVKEPSKLDTLYEMMREWNFTVLNKYYAGDKPVGFDKLYAEVLAETGASKIEW